jgi:hypothetical protein
VYITEIEHDDGTVHIKVSYRNDLGNGFEFLLAPRSSYVDMDCTQIMDGDAKEAGSFTMPLNAAVALISGLTAVTTSCQEDDTPEAYN